MSKLPARFNPIVLPLIVSGIMSCVISGISTLQVAGLNTSFAGNWMSAWLASWAVAFPVLFFVLPLARRIVAAVVEPPPGAR
jgi:hypothetical protein